MEIGLIFGMMLGCVGLGYYLRFWHDAPELAAREEMLEQRIEQLSRGVTFDQFWKGPIEDRGRKPRF